MPKSDIAPPKQFEAMSVSANETPFEEITKECTNAVVSDDETEESFDELSEDDFAGMNDSMVAAEVEAAIAAAEKNRGAKEVVESIKTIETEPEKKDTEEKEAEKKGTEQVPELEVGEWIQYAVDKFDLSADVALYESGALAEQSFLKDEDIWKHYFDARTLLIQACQSPLDKSKDQLTADEAYKLELQQAFQLEWRESELGSLLQKHTYMRTGKVMKDPQSDVLRDATIVSTIFSPYLLPRALQLCCRYHRSPRANDFWCTWHIQFISFKDDFDANMNYWKPHLYDMWELCSNGYLPMPSMEIPFMPVEDIDTAYLTPNMVRKMRKWLFGNAASYSIVDDLSLLKYVFGSCGAVRNFTILGGDIGHSWKASDIQAADMKSYGSVSESEVERATSIPTNWLEFQCRMISGSLRSIDQWFEPYDQKYHKGVWGEKVLEHRFKTRGYQERNAHILANPHKVWEQTLKTRRPIVTPRLVA